MNLAQLKQIARYSSALPGLQGAHPTAKVGMGRSEVGWGGGGWPELHLRPAGPGCWVIVCDWSAGTPPRPASAQTPQH